MTNPNLPRRRAPLSPREQAVLTLLARGYDPAGMATVLGISRDYVYTLIRLLKARFGTSTHAGVVSGAIREGFITPDGTLRETPQDEDTPPEEKAESDDERAENEDDAA